MLANIYISLFVIIDICVSFLEKHPISMIYMAPLYASWFVIVIVIVIVIVLFFIRIWSWLEQTDQRDGQYQHTMAVSILQCSKIWITHKNKWSHVKLK